MVIIRLGRVESLIEANLIVILINGQNELNIKGNTFM